MANHIVGTDLFQAVFQLVERENEDNYLFSRLKKTVESMEETPDSFILKFKGSMKVVIKNNLDDYYIITDSKNVYCNGEDEYTKLSSDRLAFYINRVLDIVMYDR